MNIYSYEIAHHVEELNWSYQKLSVTKIHCKLKTFQSKSADKPWYDECREQEPKEAATWWGQLTGIRGELPSDLGSASLPFLLTEDKKANGVN